MTERNPQSPDEIMADIERTRSEIDAALSALEQRISPRELVNALSGALVPARDGTTLFARNLGVTVRDNPVPAALVGLGLGWLAVSGSRGAGDGRVVAYQGGDTFDHVRANPSRPHHDDVIIGEAPLEPHSVSEPHSPSFGDKARDAADSISDKARDAADRLSERSRDASERLRETADDVTERARRTTDHLHRRTSDVSGRLSVRAQHAASAGRDFAREHPLGIALAVAGLGALVAATAIVRSEPRRRYIAEQAGRVRSEIADRSAHVADAARDAAARTRDQAKDLGERARDMGERARDQARDMGDRARDTARDVGERAKDLGDRARETAESAADKVRAKSEEARGKAEGVAQRVRSGDDRAKTIDSEGAATAAHTSASAGAGGIDPTPGSSAAGASSAAPGATSLGAGGVDPTPSGPGAGAPGGSGVDSTASTGAAPIHRAAVPPQGPLPDGPLNQGARANVKKDAAPSPASKAD